jgi:hypothetical protein
MPILPRPSASPLPSYASRPGYARPVSFIDALRTIGVWFAGRRPNWRERFAEQRLIEKLAAELEEGETKPRETKMRRN